MFHFWEEKDKVNSSHELWHGRLSCVSMESLKGLVTWQDLISIKSSTNIDGAAGLLHVCLFVYKTQNRASGTLETV